MLRWSTVPLLAALAVLVVPASAPAKINVTVGIGDQNMSMFSQPLYQALHLKKTRYFIEWNAIDQPGELADADAFVNKARFYGIKVLMHVSADNINSKPRRPLPSTSAYRKKVKKLIARYKPLGVTDWGAWNEANHQSQPTQKNPARAAQFFLQMRSLCSGCTIVALDVLDQSKVQTYVHRFYRALGRTNRKKAKIIGIHNYSEVNRKLKEKHRKPGESTTKFPGTKRIINAARSHYRSVKFWYTETGGQVRFANKFPCNPARAADRLKYMFTLARRYKRYIRRLYTFNWTPTPDCYTTARFDAGLVNPDGSARPGYFVIKNQLKNFKR